MGVEENGGYYEDPIEKKKKKNGHPSFCFSLLFDGGRFLACLYRERSRAVQTGKEGGVFLVCKLTVCIDNGRPHSITTGSLLYRTHSQPYSSTILIHLAVLQKHWLFCLFATGR